MSIHLLFFLSHVPVFLFLCLLLFFLSPFLMTTTTSCHLLVRLLQVFLLCIFLFVMTRVTTFLNCS